MTENTFETVQQGRHAVRDLLSKGYKAARSAEGVDPVESKVVGIFTGEARNLLRGVVGLSQEQQVERLTKAGGYINRAAAATEVEAAKEAFAEAAAILNEASDTNGAVTEFAASRDFEAHQEAKRSARYGDEPTDSEGSDEDFYDDGEDDEEE